MIFNSEVTGNQKTTSFKITFNIKILMRKKVYGDNFSHVFYFKDQSNGITMATNKLHN
jgi:hypothetical protein